MAMLLEMKMHKIKRPTNFIIFPSNDSRLLVMKEKIIKGNNSNKIDFNMRLMLKNSSLMTNGIEFPNA